jgi:hypothetical protein
MSVTLTGTPSLFRRMNRYGSSQKAANVAKAVGEHVRRVLRDRVISGQVVNVRSSELIGSWDVIDFELPFPGATLFSDVFYARIVNYRRRAGGGPPRLYLQHAIRLARPGIHDVAAKAWRLQLAG